MSSVYRYLDDPEMVAENQQSPHVILRPYQNAQAARAGDGESPWLMSLDGTWSFTHAMAPDALPSGFFAEHYDTSGWDQLQVPHVWQQDGYDTPIYRNSASDVAPYDPPRVPRDMNPAGAYVREFSVPTDWSQRRSFLRFEGVTSGYFVWVNGEYVGYDSGGYTPAEFDVSDVLQPGQNRLAVQVHRWSAGSYLENMDMWHFSGIFREVWLYSTPPVWLRDVAVTTQLGDGYQDADLGVTATVGATGVDAGRHTVRATLFNAAKKAVCAMTADVPERDAAGVVELAGHVDAPTLWSDEQPNLYRLVLELVDPAGTVIHTVGQDVGFRAVEVIDGQMCLNGVPVILRGVNRHEHDPERGRAVPYERLVQDIKMLKQHNVNAVRASHYPNDPRWYELCNRYGIYVCDEVDVETHVRMNVDNNLADEPQWRTAMLDRFVAMVQRDKNHPCVVMWSTGNEAGLGAAHFAMADYARQHDPSRLLYHQPTKFPLDGDAPYADVWGPRYPSLTDLARIAEVADRPVVLGEWAHVLGNGLGNFEDMWQLIRAERQLQGGFMWEWLSQELSRPLITTPDGSGNDIAAFLSGNPRVVAGRDGSAVYFTGLDDWVEVADDPRLNTVGEALTVDTWIKPGAWSGDFTVVSKGPQFTLRMRDENALEFGVDIGTVRMVVAAFPASDHADWHRVTGTYDGDALRLFIDGSLRAEVPANGRIVATPRPVTIGRNPDTHRDRHRGRTAHGTVDSVRIYDTALTADQLASDPYHKAVLALDFDEFTDSGRYDSYGVGEFIADGVIAADRTPLPAAEQLKYSHAPIRFAPVDAAGGIIEVTNGFGFEDTTGIELHWEVTDGAQILAEGVCRPEIGPGEAAKVDLAMPPLAASNRAERWLNLRAVLAHTAPWVDAGHVVAFEQLDARASGGDAKVVSLPSRIAPAAERRDVGKLEVDREAKHVSIRGAGFEYRFNADTGELDSMRAGELELLEHGPQLLVWRAALSNEDSWWGGGKNPPGKQFRSVGLHQLTSKVTNFEVNESTSGSVLVVAQLFDCPPSMDYGFEHTMTYEVDGGGRATLHHTIVGVGELIRALPWLPRIGLSIAMPAQFDRFTWYGRGPGESYPDRKDASFMGLWSSYVDEQFVSYLPPQDNGAKADTSWARLTDADGAGLEVAGDHLTVSVSRFDDNELDRATYPFLLSSADFVVLNVAHRITGVGDTPNLVHPDYRVPPDQPYDYSLVLTPVADERIR